jgi:DNA-binding YbaB/EbfC family protein
MAMAKGFGGLGNMAGIFKQAQEMQAKMSQIQEQLAQKTVEASSGGGMVKVVVNGQLVVSSVKIDPSVMNPQEIDMLEDLVLAAVNEGLRRAREMAAEEMSKVTGGLKIPGLTG